MPPMWQRCTGGPKVPPGTPQSPKFGTRFRFRPNLPQMPQGTQGTPQGSQRHPVYLQGAPQGPKYGTKIPNCPKVHQMYLVSQAPQGTQRYTGYPSGNPSGVHKVPAGFGNKIIFVPNLEKYPCSEFGTHCKNTAPHCTAGGIVTCSV